VLDLRIGQSVTALIKSAALDSGAIPVR
jgi:hypothetical protein